MKPTELRTIRVRLKLTQTALAERLGVKRRCVQYWEAGGRKIPEPVIRLLATLRVVK